VSVQAGLAISCRSNPGNATRTRCSSGSALLPSNVAAMASASDSVAQQPFHGQQSDWDEVPLLADCVFQAIVDGVSG